ncbi:MAG: aldo/keto reductase [Lachnospiraceae bacterium]|nr:aldo/keto reductase [Lachnospiraceae bacterium]
MQYRNDRNGVPLSILGYGCMRFTKNGRSFDFDKAERELMEAYNMGVNYYDSAYIYSGSEALIGEVFEKNGIRDKINIATKLPQYLVGSTASSDRYFNEELKRLRTEYIDYYLMHMITDLAQWEKLERIGMKEWIADKKANGQIRNIGFSYHGDTENFLKVLNAYDWDFCQIQYNYVDVHTQAGMEGLKAANAKGIPVIIMEPLRGGKLVSMLPAEAKQLVASDPSGYSPAELAFRWLWDQPEVTCVLSGMNSLEMVRENCQAADTAAAGAFTPEQHELVQKIRDIFLNATKVGCTECRYCMPCPKGVNIPGIFRCYNLMFTENKGSGRKEYMQAIALNGDPSFATQCIGCGKCEQHCPQHIPIREKLKEADRALRPLPYRIALPVARRIMLHKK